MVFSGALVGTRTPNLLIRSQTLYPIELRVLWLPLPYCIGGRER